MPSFRYKAVDHSGQVVEGVLVADTHLDARAQLRHKNLYPESVRRAEGRGFRLSDLLPGSQQRARREVALFTRECAILLASGVSIVEALEVMARQAHDRHLSRALSEVHEAVSAGQSLADALSSHPRLFDRSYVQTIASGEESGMLNVVLKRLADFLERRQQMASQLTASLVYPCLLVCVTVGLLAFLAGYVVPMMEPLLRQHRGALPVSTRALFRVSGAVRANLWMALPAMALLGAAAAWTRLTQRGRRLLDALLLRLPLVGGLVRRSLVSRFSMSFATLLHTGVPADRALQTLAKLMPNAVFADEIARIRERVVEGGDISDGVESCSIFPPLAGYMVEVGERSGALVEVLENISAACDHEVRVGSRRLLALLEPVLILVLASVVGFIAMSLMVTILQLSAL